MKNKDLEQICAYQITSKDVSIIHKKNPVLIDYKTCIVHNITVDLSNKETPVVITKTIGIPKKGPTGWKTDLMPISKKELIRFFSGKVSSKDLERIKQIIMNQKVRTELL